MKKIQVSPERISLHFDYGPDFHQLVSACKEIGMRFDGNTKAWYVDVKYTNTEKAKKILEFACNQQFESDKEIANLEEMISKGVFQNNTYNTSKTATSTEIDCRIVKDKICFYHPNDVEFNKECKELHLFWDKDLRCWTKEIAWLKSILYIERLEMFIKKYKLDKTGEILAFLEEKNDQLKTLYKNRSEKNPKEVKFFPNASYKNKKTFQKNKAQFTYNSRRKEVIPDDEVEEVE